MSIERFEWLEIRDQTKKRRKRKTDASDTVMGKRGPECGWLDEETVTQCFRCGHRYNVDPIMSQKIEQLGVALPQRVIETPQNLENFFRTHGRIRPPEPLELFQLRMRAQQLRLSRGFDRLVCLDELDLEHYDHQLEAALRALQDMRGRALLADEVGLGKTI